MVEAMIRRFSSFRPSLSKYLLTWIVSRGFFIAFFVNLPAPLFEKLYGPFVQNFIVSPTLDPWSQWLSASGAPEAFPYGWPMLLVLAAGQLVGLVFQNAWLGHALALLILDLMTFILLLKIRFAISGNAAFVAYAYVLSPLPILAVFLSASTDFLPMLLVLVAFVSLASNRPVLAGVMLGTAVGSKLILAVVLVGAVLYFARSRRGLKDTVSLVSSMVLALLISLSPLLYSGGFRAALMASDDATGALSWGIPSPAGNLLLLPLIVFAVWFAVYQLGRMNTDLLALALATPVLITASLPGAPIGWSLWAFPLVLLLAASLPNRFKVLSIVAVNATSLSFLLASIEAGFSIALSELQRGLVITSTLAIAVITAVLLWRENYTRSDFVRLRARPALVLIAGDSGVGKDTLADGLASILGRESTVHISGDDYHRWDRGNASWNHFTHLNPNANELPKFFNDILTLSDGGDIRAGKYDHRVGRRISPQTARGREFVIASGLHALLISDMNRQASLAVYLEMAEDLRAKLKLERDTLSRGHKPEDVLRSIEARLADSEKFIQPQRNLADLVVRTSVIEGLKLEDSRDLEVEFESEPKVFDAQLLSELSVTCSLEVSVEMLGHNRRKFRVRGSSSTQDLATAFGRLEPRISAILGDPKLWSDGPAGISQLVTMVYLANALRRERLVK
jgi:uridine kinase